MAEISTPEIVDTLIERATVAGGGAALLLLMGSRPQPLAATQLRAACRCAQCVRARADGLFPRSFDGIAIERVSPVGSYGINVAFSDGHARGIYPWAYLSKLLKE
jgi:prepilin-type processing-associated H-X9-DG protein